MVQDPGNEDIIIYQCKVRQPDYTIESIVSVSLPYYSIDLRGTRSAPRQISTVARFLLLVIGQEDCSEDEAASLLGLNQSDLESYTAELFTAGLIDIRQFPDARYLSVTESGRSYILNNDSVRSHVAVTCDVLFNPLTGDLEEDEKLEGNDGEIQFRLPTRFGRPAVADLDLEDLRSIESYKDVTDVSRIADVFFGYDTRLSLALLTLPEDENSRKVMLFRGIDYLDEETEILQDILQSEEDNSLLEMFSDESPEFDFLPAEFHELRGPVNAIIQSEKRIKTIEQDILYRQRRLSEAEGASTRRSLQNEVARLSSELSREQNRLNGEIATFWDAYRGSERRFELKVIRTQECRPHMFKAFRAAKREVVVVSGFVSRGACDRELREAVRECVARGVRVRFAWGLATYGGGQENAEFALRRGREVEELIRRALKGLDGNLFVMQRAPTHEKILICDDSFAVAGSFNWLSYRGEDYSKTGRRELGVYSEDPSYIEQLRKLVDDLF